jgi:uncharacterized protein YkwD
MRMLRSALFVVALLSVLRFGFAPAPSSPGGTAVGRGEEGRAVNAIESRLASAMVAAVRAKRPALRSLPALDDRLAAVAQRVIAERTDLASAFGGHAPSLPEVVLRSYQVQAYEWTSSPGHVPSDLERRVRRLLDDTPAVALGEGSHFGVGVAMARDGSRTVILWATATPIPRLYTIPSSLGPIPARSGDAAAVFDPPNRAEVARISAHLAAVEAEIFVITNRYRADADLRPLAADALLDGIARRHGIDMARRDFYAHVNPDGLGPHERISRTAGWGDVMASAENINWFGDAATYLRSDPSVLARAMMEGWIHSEGHRRNLVSEQVTMLGVGLAYDGRNDRIFGTQKFAARRNW